jgi:hypothetical protein
MKTSEAGTRMVRRVFRENASFRCGLYEAMAAAATMLNEKETKMARPPRRGRGLLCRCLS